MLGDLVGYGAEPNAVIDRVRALNPLATIRGNHDKAACGIEDGSSFNYVARLAAQWTFEALIPRTSRVPARAAAGTDDDRRQRRDLPRCAVRRRPLHLRLATTPAAPRFRDPPACVCSAIPTCRSSFDETRASSTASCPKARTTRSFEIEPGLNYLINVGSVGQPRDGDPRAAFGIYDSSRLFGADSPSRIPGPDAQRRILDAGLPASLANRLGIGR